MFAPLWCYNAHPILWCLYDSYGLAVLQQLQDLMRSRRFVGLLILGISALIAAISSVTAAAISLTQQVHTAQYVDTMSKNVSLTLATQEAIDRKLEFLSSPMVSINPSINHSILAALKNFFAMNAQK